MEKLTLKETKFIENYLKSGNGREAIIAAGYKVKNGNVAGVMAYEMVRKPHITSAINNVFKESEVNQQWVLEQLKNLALTSESDGIRTKSLELLGKHLNMFTSKPEVPSEITISFGDPRYPENLTA